MNGDDPSGFAALWLSELGAHVPEHHDGIALAPREVLFGLDLTPAERARRNSARLILEARRARRAARA